MIGLVSVMSALAVAGGSIGFFVFPSGLEMGVKGVINLKPNGFVYPKYMSPPFSTNTAFYLHQILNPREVLSGGKARIKLKGPYVGSTTLKRSNISFERDSEIVRYDSGRFVTLNEERSADLDERFYVVNPIVPSVALMVRQIVLDRIPFSRLAEPIVFNSVNALLDTYQERLFVKGSPRDLLVGRRVQMLDMILGVADRFGLASLVPPGPPDNTFGLIHAQNKLVNPMAIWTGLGSKPDKFAEVAQWKGKSTIEAWKGRCSIINGTNGELYKPFLEKGKPIKIFLPDLCRTFYIDPVGEVITDQGTRAYEYELSNRLYQGAKNNPGNICYCSNSRTYDCQYDGLVNMAPCFFNSPLFFSKSNFKGVDNRIKRMLAEESIVQNVPDKQSFYLDPITATVLKANVTFLGLFKVVRQPYMRDLAKIQNLTYIPLFSAHESIIVPKSVTWQILALQIFSDYHKFIFAGMAASGIALVGMKFMRRRSQVQESQEN